MLMLMMTRMMVSFHKFPKIFTHTFWRRVPRRTETMAGCVCVCVFGGAKGSINISSHLMHFRFAGCTPCETDLCFAGGAWKYGHGETHGVPFHYCLFVEWCCVVPPSIFLSPSSSSLASPRASHLLSPVWWCCRCNALFSLLGTSEWPFLCIFMNFLRMGLVFQIPAQR